MRRPVLIMLFIFQAFLTDLYAQTGIASTGIWAQASTWSFAGVNRIPTCGDTLIIPVNVTVTVNAMENYTACSSVLTIIIEGTLQLSNGNKVKLPCGSTVTLLAGGIVKKSTPGGGSSTLIEICSCNAWTAGQGAVTGPGSLTCTILPVTMLYFNARSIDNEVDLTWATATETNNSYFDIERSADGKTFEDIGKILGHGTTNITQTYSYFDQLPLEGISYYRLKQVDFDNKFTYSDIVVVEVDNLKSLNILPSYSNSDNDLRLIISSSSSNFCIIKLFDMYGKNIITTKIETPNGNCIYNFPAELTKGNYLVNITDGKNSVSSTISIR